MTVFDILALARAEDQSPSLAEIRPIMHHHLQQLGPLSFVNATYETFLGHPAEVEVLDNFVRNSNGILETALDSVLGSFEYKNKNIAVIPGLFSSTFRYSLSALDMG